MTAPWSAFYGSPLHRIENNLLVAAGKGEEMSGATRGCHPLIAALRVKSPSPKKSPGVFDYNAKSQEGDS